METLERAYAKLNLSLDTPYLHDDGQQEWDMLMVPIDLADTVTMTTTATHNDIRVTSTSGVLPSNEKNLAYQAAELMRTVAQVSRGIEIHIDKHIPVAAGLGGGSADAAAVMRGLNRQWELGLSEAALAKMALEIDADVPFCIYSRPAWVTGRGEIVTPLTHRLPLSAVVVSKPRLSVSTPKMLKLIDYTTLRHGDMAGLRAAVAQEDYPALVHQMFNVLEPVTMARYPQIERLKQKMTQFGADVAQMSGTGPTVFAITNTPSRAKRIYNAVSGFIEETYLVHIIQTVNEKGV